MSDWVIAVIALVIGLVALSGIAVLWDIKVYSRYENRYHLKNKHGRYDR